MLTAYMNLEKSWFPKKTYAKTGLISAVKFTRITLNPKPIQTTHLFQNLMVELYKPKVLIGKVC